ncbi:MAG: UPF0182 family protein, partial [Candidatus Binatota bacterium]
QIFTTTLTFKLTLGLVFGALFFLLIYFNVKLAAHAPRNIRFLEQENAIELPSPELVDPLIQRLLLPVAILLGLFAGPQAASHWQSLLLFFNSVPFGIEDPLFSRDISFYVFRLPALTALYNWLTFSLGLTILATAFTYLLYRGVQYGPRGLFLTERARGHLLCLVAVFLLVKAGGYYLDTFELLYSSRGAAFGATYADVYANLPALRVLAFLALIVSGLTLFQIYRQGFMYLFVGLGALVLVHLVGLNLYPSLVQRFRVVPNEAVAERLFIERNIQFTRRAYGLDKIESKDFPAEEQLTAADLKRNDPTIKNIRLWEHRPLLATYAQLQEIRTYYKFVDVDNDRYLING